MNARPEDNIRCMRTRTKLIVARNPSRLGLRIVSSLGRLRQRSVAALYSLLVCLAVSMILLLPSEWSRSASSNTTVGLLNQLSEIPALKDRSINWISDAERERRRSQSYVGDVEAAVLRVSLPVGVMNDPR